MDPLSLSASIIAVLTLSSTVLKYLNDVKDATDDRQSIYNEIIFASGLLRIFHDLVKQGEGWSVTVASLAIPNGPLEQFDSTLKRLESKLRPVSGVRKATRTLLWPFQKEEIKDILRAIERQKSLFSLAVHNDHM